MTSNARFIENPVSRGEFIASHARSGLSQEVALQFGKCELVVSDLDVSSALIVLKKLRSLPKGELLAESVHFMAKGVPIVCTRFFECIGERHAVPEWYMLKAGPVKISLEQEAMQRFMDELSQLDVELRAQR